jgi:tetratricopeptide (TPR) repeat protein
VHSRLRQWRRYPFATGGPLVATSLASTALAGVVSALTLPRFSQFWPGLLAVAASDAVIRVARRRFMRRRDIVRPKIRRTARQQAFSTATAAAAVIPLVVVIVLGWGLGWIWPLWALMSFAFQLGQRRKWARLGYPGDPRWAYDWSPEADPAYKFRLIFHLRAGRYGEARQFLLQALEAEPGDRAILYNLACAEALGGEHDAALAHLNDAIGSDERLREQARRDPDLVSIRDNARSLRTDA